MRSSAIDTVLAFMQAFHEQDRPAAEALMHDDFVFTSPRTTTSIARPGSNAASRAPTISTPPA